jgi:23S rRNA (pseudouridine1915-N3)-methyltransferase
MKIALGAIGHVKSGPERELADDYEKRIRTLGRKAGMSGVLVKEWTESQAATPAQRQAEEARQLWSLAYDGPVVLMDERGKTMASAAFARWLETTAAKGARQTTFLLGGPDGHAAESRQKAELLLSFGPMTFPHRLARIMLLEQLYRAITILVNHPYHRP